MNVTALERPLEGDPELNDHPVRSAMKSTLISRAYARGIHSQPRLLRSSSTNCMELCISACLVAQRHTNGDISRRVLS